ncbi:hypothetical protein DICSQDRAFT_166262 [Dichomitus squalens LYAD-421 SS1]|uniref:uncharacterized protein n=1 Tax=Dichomitus squalens (strain LYAD-421) TaxID=732165 RepID=UPI0004411D4B|nr:uncharacterized protein DICSQDRAFT_166262 [Dichomitus squalens LYAD-421 SS1]EJF65209.1 hypothetical protein DICSQDRAFT_166262 [Dichomitus squalens LYAD-421 SS1]
MPLPYQLSASNRNLPRRSDSLHKVNKAPYFSEVDDELRDIRRVHSQGQEEDLRYALSRTINRIEELTSMLKEAYKAQADLQTELTLAKSNLQMALANNEMLEDALKRDPGHSKDIGWRRMSAREQSLKAEAEAERRRSTDSLTSTDASSSPTLSQPSSAAEHSPVVLRSATMPSPAPSSTTENRFFRFRFGNGPSSSSHPSSPRLSAGQSPVANGSHLTSASLPSLVPARDWDKEIEELQHQLEAERNARKQTADAKASLEAEIESLSQALFEEANKMVATERMKRAETEEQLREAREQGEALKNVLRLFEHDTAAGKTRAYVVDGINDGTPVARSRHRASSSAVGIKSPSSGVPSPQSSRPNTPVQSPNDVPSSARTVTADPSSTASLEGISISGASAAVPQPEPTAAPSVVEVKSDASVSTGIESSPLPSSKNTLPHISPSPPALSASQSPSPVPSPLSAPGQFLFTPARPVNYYEGEESPWADATSASSAKVST